MTISPSTASAGRSTLLLTGGAALLVILLALVSLNTGASQMKLLHLLTQPDDRVTRVLFASRLPRTIALILAGAGLAVAGLLMQMLARNRLVEPGTVGTFSAASFGMLLAALINPGMALWLKFVLVSICATLGSWLFLAILQRIPLRSALIVPLVGLVLSAVLASGSGLVASQFELGQALRAWSSGDFSAILRGRYELLWIAAGMTVLAMLLADRFTVIGMGKDFATNVGINYAALMVLGVLMVSLISASVVITAGALPFVGLLVPNLVRALVGDNMRRGIVLVALCGAALMLTADLLGRLLIHPYEVPSANLLAIAGSLVFIVILLRGRRQWA